MIGEGKGLRPWVYYAKSTGFFRTLHRVTGPILIAIMLATPWIRFGGAPLFRIDLAERHLFFLGQLFTSLDVRFLLVIGLGSAIGLGLMTSVAGRAWCGYACPQTVFLEEVVRRIETLLEGDRGARRKLDEGKWDFNKIWRKTAKWTSFALVSFVIAMSFISFFADPRVVWTGGGTPALYAVMTVVGGLLYFDLAWFREQFCNYLCPYARIQGALTDRHSLVIGYHPERGEPRLGIDGATKKAVLLRGGCVDCGRCVSVCPQGIDIRNGYQLECITCGHCIDACTTVMGKHGHKSLISYTTEAKLQGDPPSGIRKRPLVYVAILAVIGTLGLVELIGRESYEAHITRIVGAEFSQLADGSVQNAFDAHVWNNAIEPMTVEVRVEGLAGARIVTAQNPITVPHGQDAMFPLFVIAPQASIAARSTPIEFVFVSGDAEIRRPGTFLANPRAR